MNKTEKAIYELLKKSVLSRDEKGIYTIFPQTADKSIRQERENYKICSKKFRRSKVHNPYHVSRSKSYEVLLFERRRSDRA